MSVSSRELDRLEATFDHDGIVANALIDFCTLVATAYASALNAVSES